MKPSLGRIVHAVVRGPTGHGRTLAAIVTEEPDHIHVSLKDGGTSLALGVTVFSWEGALFRWLPGEPNVMDLEGNFWMWPVREGP